MLGKRCADKRIYRANGYAESKGHTRLKNLPGRKICLNMKSADKKEANKKSRKTESRNQEQKTRLRTGIERTGKEIRLEPECRLELFSS